MTLGIISRDSIPSASSEGCCKKLKKKELRILMAKELDKSWKEVCASSMMEKAFANVRLRLKLDESQDHMMKFQEQTPGKP